MIKARRTTEGIEVEQLSTGPYVYLDQWLWADLASDAPLRGRAIAVFESVRPTIMYSMTTYYELLKITDSHQLDNIASVMDSCDFMLIVSNPRTALNSEASIPSYSEHAVNINPISDNEMLRAVLIDLEEKDRSTITGSSVLRVAMMSNNIDTIRRCRTAFADSLNPIVEKARAMPTAQREIKKRAALLSSTTNHFPCTSVVYQRAIDFIVSNTSMKMPENEWLDVMHTVVPVSYADYVAVDSRWHHFVSTDQILKKCTTARTYCRSTVDQFFTDIQSRQFSRPAKPAADCYVR